VKSVLYGIVAVAGVVLTIDAVQSHSWWRIVLGVIVVVSFAVAAVKRRSARSRRSG
jgi:hypothetical protein